MALLRLLVRDMRVGSGEEEEEGHDFEGAKLSGVDEV